MRSRKLPALVLVTIGGAIACANLWFAAARSLIPISIDERVEAGEMRFEKHPGVDDVFLVTFASGMKVQVDKPVYHRLEPGSHIEKKAWEKTMTIDGREQNLRWSLDMKRMRMAMPLVGVGILVMAWRAGRRW